MVFSPVKETVNSATQDINNSPDDLLRAIVDACISNVAVLDESGAIIYASKAWDLFERSSQEKTSAAASYFESFRRFTTSEFDDEATITLADDIQHILFGDEKEFHRQYSRHGLNESRPFLIHAARLNLPGTNFRVLITHEALSFVQDEFRDSKELLIDLLGSKILAKDVGGRLIAAQEEERRRVARELHDDFNQRLALLSLELEQLAQEIEKPIALRERVKRLQGQAQEIATEIHRLSYRLHPSKLDHVGLAPAVKSLCTELTQSGKLKVSFHQTGFPAALDRDVTLCVFRIAQEGLRNCVKHSGAESARVVLSKTRNAVRLVVSDNGCGFNAKTPLMQKGLGFISMQERLHVLGGQLNVYSKPLRGTRIEVSVPLKLNPDALANDPLPRNTDEKTAFEVNGGKL